jgi:hypothetical protein
MSTIGCTNLPLSGRLAGSFKADAMKSALQAMAWPNLLARWRSLDNRDLWGLLAAIFEML